MSDIFERKISKGDIIEGLTYFGHELVVINNDKNIPESEIGRKLDEIIAKLNRRLHSYRINIRDVEVLDDAIIYTFALDPTVKDEPDYYAWMKIYRHNGYRYGITISMRKEYQLIAPFTFRFTKNFVRRIKVGEFTNMKSFEYLDKITNRLLIAEQKKDGWSLKAEVNKIIGELEEEFINRLKLNYQILLHILKETAKEFGFL